MKKNKFYYILIITISFSIISSLTSISLAEDKLVNTASGIKEDFGPGDRNFFDEIIQVINKKIINPVKQKINSIRNNGLDDIQEQVKEKQEELIDKAQDKAKQTIKERSKRFIQNRIEWIKKALNPLKIKIQQGSDVIRKEFNKLKNYLKDLF